MNLRTLCLSAALLAAPIACAKAPAAAVIEDALATGERGSAIDRLEGALPLANKREAAWIQVYLGEQHRLEGNADAARSAFDSASRSGVAGADRAGELGRVLVGRDAPPTGDALEVLRTVTAKNLPDSMNADRFLWLSLRAAAGTDTDATRSLVRRTLSYAASDPEVDARIRARLAAVVDTPPDDAPVDAPAEGDTEPTLVDRLDQAVAAGDRTRVQTLAEELAASAEAGSDEAAIAAYATKRLDRSIDANTVAVLLPLSGKYKGVGSHIRKAVQMGWRSGGGTRRLVFIDTGADAESAASAVERAILEEGAIAVIGPLRTELAGDVARVANALRAPLLGLHQDSMAADDRPWILDGIATPEAQVEALLDYAMGVKGMEAFAIFAPENDYGQAAADVFTAKVQARGGQITAREHYDTESTDLIPFAKKLGRKDYEGRAAEFRQIKREIADAGGDPRRAVLPPVIDFDAVFLPDNRRRVPMAAAGLAYEEFPVGQFKIDKDGPTCPLLGLSGWNHPELVTTGGPYVRDSLFVDPWFPENSPEQAFIERFRAETGRVPNTLIAQVWSAARIAGAGSKADAQTPDAFREALFNVQLGTPTATGAERVDRETRRVEHAHHILTITREAIEEIRTVSPGDDDDDPADGTDPPDDTTPPAPRR